MLKFLVVCLSLCAATGVTRQRRYLIYPDNSRVQLIVGTGVPVPLENQSVTVGWVAKSAYRLITNATELTTPYVTFQKRSQERRASRYDFYRSFEKLAESFGGGGKTCMLKAICEAAKTPLKASGLIGQLLHIFLTPSTTDESAASRTDLEYHSAEHLGKDLGTTCANLYPSCTVTVMDILTVIM